jgi:RES domain-containing protein
LVKRETEPGVRELFDAIASCLPDAIALDQVLYRSAAVKHANADDFLSGAGAAVSGGRWNPVGMKAAYASLSIDTAIKEAYQNILHYGFPPSTIRPRVMAGAHVELGCVLDLTDPSIRRRLGFTLSREAGEAGFEGLLAPSAQDRPRGVNVVIFSDRLLPGSKIVILGEEELPPHPPWSKLQFCMF